MKELPHLKSHKIKMHADMMLHHPAMSSWQQSTGTLSKWKKKKNPQWYKYIYKCKKIELEDIKNQYILF